MLNLNSIMIGSTQAEALAGFYEKMFGKPADWDEEGWYGWQAGSTHFMIGEHSEVVAKLCEAGIPEKAVYQVLPSPGLEVVAFDEEQTHQAGLLRVATQVAGLSLGDRACLNLARKLGVPALTADRTWSAISPGAAVRVIR